MKKIIASIIRLALSSLSFFFKNDLEITKDKNKELTKEISSKLTNFNFYKDNINDTHIEFNKNLLKFLSSQNIFSFLRKSFIQQMFFVHNRLFIFSELQHLKRSSNWEFYKFLIEEDNIGDPIRYFLYPRSSGNRINHVFHLSILSEEFNIDLKKIDYVFEFGGGYGCMARIFSKINNGVNYIVFDLELVNYLQYFYLKSNNLSVGINYSRKQFKLINKQNEIQNDIYKFLKNNHYLFIANWSFSEIPLNYRIKFVDKIKESQYFLICFQEYFENINNLKYFQSLEKKLKINFETKIIKNIYYKGNFLKKENHFFLIGKKI